MMEFLKPDSCKEKPKEWFVWDIETRKNDGISIPELRAIGCYHLASDRYWYFDTWDGFFNLLRHNEDCIFYAHYGGRFDFLFLLDWLSKLKEKTRVHIILSSSRIIIAKILVREYMTHKHGKPYKQSKYVTLWDSYSLFQKRLSKLLKLYNLDWKKGEVDYKKFDDDIYWNEVGKPYLENDCRSLAQIINYFHEKIYGIGGKVRPTLAATSLATYRSVFLERPIVRNDDINDDLRAGYIGGRCEVF